MQEAFSHGSLFAAVFQEIHQPLSNQFRHRMWTLRSLHRRNALWHRQLTTQPGSTRLTSMLLRSDSLFLLWLQMFLQLFSN